MGCVTTRALALAAACTVLVWGALAAGQAEKSGSPIRVSSTASRKETQMTWLSDSMPTRKGGKLHSRCSGTAASGLLRISPDREQRDRSIVNAQIGAS